MFFEETKNGVSIFSLRFKSCMCSTQQLMVCNSLAINEILIKTFKWVVTLKMYISKLKANQPEYLKNYIKSQTVETFYFGEVVSSFLKIKAEHVYRKMDQSSVYCAKFQSYCTFVYSNQITIT